MSRTLILIAFLAIYSVSALNVHQIAKRQTSESNGSSVTLQLTQLLSNTWNTLTSNLRSNESESRLNEIQTNLTNWRNSLTQSGSGVAQDLMNRVQNITQHLNTVLRERAHNDQDLVGRLYHSIVNMTTNGTNHSINSLRQAFTTATQTMAENFSGLANHSLLLASDLRDNGSQVFSNAMVRAGNDTNRAIIAVNTAINAIRNSSQSVNSREVAANLTHNVQRLSAQMRSLVNENPIGNTVQNLNTEFKERAQQSLQSLMSSMDNLRNSLGQFSNNTNTNDNNVEDNEINVIQTASKAITREYQSLQNQINSLRNQNQSSNSK